MSKIKNNVIYVLIILLLLMSVILNISLSKNLKDVFNYQSQCLVNVADYNSDLSEVVNGSKENESKNKAIYNAKEHWDDLRGFMINSRNYTLNTVLLRKYLSKVDGTMINISDKLNAILLKDVNDLSNEDKDFLNKFINLTSSIQKEGSDMRSKVNFMIPIYTNFKVRGNLNNIVDTIIGSQI
ncbi:MULTISPECIES: hypothetical protein [unclassified Romboutsia]|uniref:hypothetical protein n=1 Tax=unclassified Romboutsia TaxID=2626894 RepID=UPI00082331D8|nr:MULTISPECIES: hypothetical protein [unclassified Romboutsia]SCI15661.1 Uncharacterised protein [uncultured Clostridium sp.]